MKRIAIAALLLAGCTTTGTVSLTAERAAALARASHAQACGVVETTHAAGILTGENFNKAKALCIQADTVLDAADAALTVGQDAVAADKVKAALDLISDIQTLAK